MMTAWKRWYPTNLDDLEADESRQVHSATRSALEFNLFLVDLAVTLTAISLPVGGESLKPDFLRAVKWGYEEVRKLTDEEVVWLPEAIRYASEALITWFMANGFERYARQQQRIRDGFEQVFGDYLAV